MKQANTHLNDEHMQMYEWSGLGAAATGALPAGSKRTHAWHASYGVLAVLTTLLILNGCDSQTTAEQKSEPAGQAADPQVFDDTAPEAAAPAMEAPPAGVGEVPPGEATGEGGAAPADAPEQP